MAVFKQKILYIGTRTYKYKNMLMSHMMSDSTDLLHTLAGELGIARKYFQDGKFPHYDISQSKIKLALKRGIIRLSDKEIIRRINIRREYNYETDTGIYEAYHNNTGNIHYKCTYKNGKCNGHYVQYYPNGCIAYIGTLNMGIMTGVWFQYNRQNVVERTEFYI